VTAKPLEDRTSLQATQFYDGFPGLCFDNSFKNTFLEIMLRSYNENQRDALFLSFI